MKLLLDTHVLIWSISQKEELSEESRRQIGDSGNLIFVSMISLWEIRIKETLRKISVPENFYGSLIPAGYEILQLSLKKIDAFGHLPLYHRDPFDRMLVAQAKAEEMTLVTRDPQLAQYDLDLLKA